MMGPDPASSVTDAYGRVHGLDNVYVADGSVFVTSGAHNPTNTLDGRGPAQHAPPGGDWRARDRVGRPNMKKLLELLVCFLHPLAVILMWINLAGRSDLSGGQKLAWGLFGLIPLVPFVYVLTGGDLW